MKDFRISLFTFGFMAAYKGVRAMKPRHKYKQNFMIPGPANILCCPFCGGEKEVMSLYSGNTIGGTVWSDTRREYPMLPEVSPIQQCPHCKKY